MGYQTTIIDGERVLHPNQRRLAEKLIWQGLVPHAGNVERVIFRVNTFIGEDFLVEYLMRVNVKLNCGKCIAEDTTCRNRQAGIRFLTDEIRKAVARETNFENRFAASSWTRLTQRFRTRFDNASLSQVRAMS